MELEHAIAVYDGSEAAEELLESVSRLVRAWRGRLTILIARTVPLAEPMPTYTPGEDAEMDAMVARADGLARSRSVNHAVHVRYVRALGPAVVSEARLHSADLVALPVPDPGRIASDLAEWEDIRLVMRQVTCAVMLYRSGR
jgi:hypothetical protein